MFRRQISSGEFGNKRKNLIGESADVQNVGAFKGLRVSVRLDVEKDEFRILISRFKLIALAHRFRAAILRAVI